HRELYLSGLRLAIGEEDGVKAGPARVDAPRDPVAFDHREAERRQITALCCELVGAAPGDDGVGLEDLRDAVSGFQTYVSEVAARHDGFVYRDLGDSALVLFGYPQVHEHDAEQAVRAGLELCAGVRCRVGIATGMVIFGDPVRVEAARDESMVGGAPRLATR